MGHLQIRPKTEIRLHFGRSQICKNGQSLAEIQCRPSVFCICCLSYGQSVVIRLVFFVFLVYFRFVEL